MWGVVLIANFVGTLFAALFCTLTPVLTPELYNGMLDISRQLMGHSFGRNVFSRYRCRLSDRRHGVAYSRRRNRSILRHYTDDLLISAASFMHIVAGSVEGFLLLLHGELGWLSMLTGFVIPVLGGNIVGGTALFALSPMRRL